MELSFADLEEGTSALKPPSYRRSRVSLQDRFQDSSSGLNLICDLAEEDEESGFAGGLMKPTKVLALKKKKVSLSKKGGAKIGERGASEEGGGKGGEGKGGILKKSGQSGSSSGGGSVETVIAGGEGRLCSNLRIG